MKMRGYSYSTMSPSNSTKIEYRDRALQKRVQTRAKSVPFRLHLNSIDTVIMYN